MNVQKDKTEIILLLLIINTKNETYCFFRLCARVCMLPYRQRFTRILPPFFIFMILYSTLPMLWGQISGETSLKDLSRIFLNFPMLAGLWNIPYAHILVGTIGNSI